MLEITLQLARELHRSLIELNLEYPSRIPPPDSQLPSRYGWNFAKAPQFCKDIVSSPKALKTCTRDGNTKLCKNGPTEMFSQFQQDYYLYTRHFSKLRRRGIYIDLAANEPWHISNSYFFDECLGWDGFCIEANKAYISKLRNHRSCRVIHNCISDKEGDNVTFVLANELGGIESTNKYMDRWKSEGSKLNKEVMHCTTLTSILTDYQIPIVDYMSLDVEGHEQKVLEGVDWKSIQFNVISIEVSAETGPPIEQLLISKGYIRHIPELSEATMRKKVLSHDAVYLHNSVEFGNPK